MPTDAMPSLPPYASFSSWTQLMRGLRVAIPPGRIDSGYLASLGLTGQKRLTIVNALRFLRLTECEDRPRTALVRLVESSGDEYREMLRNVVLEAYSSLFREMEVERRATREELEDYFRKRGAKGSVVRKSSSFFLSLAREAGMKLSPHLFGKRLRGQRAPRSRQGQTRTPTTGVSAEQGSSWRNQLIAKFPSFELEWSQELQKEWFASFRELMKILGE